MLPLGTATQPFALGPPLFLGLPRSTSGSAEPSHLSRLSSLRPTFLPVPDWCQANRSALSRESELPASDWVKQPSPKSRQALLRPTPPNVRFVKSKLHAPTLRSEVSLTPSGPLTLSSSGTEQPQPPVIFFQERKKTKEGLSGSPNVMIQDSKEQLPQNWSPNGIGVECRFS